MAMTARNMAAKLSFLGSTEQQPMDIDQVMVELDHFKKKTERLDMMNRLAQQKAPVLLRSRTGKKKGHGLCRTAYRNIGNP